MACDKLGYYPCGKCEGCLSSRASQWAVRLDAEHECHTEASFVTLTYGEPGPVDVNKDDPKLFIRSLRKKLSPKKIRFFLGSEYGPKTDRPHYHAIVFGHDHTQDEDARIVRYSNGLPLWTSPLLEAAWPHGFVSSGSVTAASIRYVANYLTGKAHVPKWMDPETGVEHECTSVFALMSRRPGIGGNWIDKHDAETYKDDTVQLAGQTRQPPRYFDDRAFRNDRHSLLALRRLRRDTVKAEMLKDPEKYLLDVNPERKVAQIKINKARRALKKQGDI